MLLCAIAALAWGTSRTPSLAQELADVLPFRVVYGRPPPEATPAIAHLWSEGGRLKLRLHPTFKGAEIQGELRLSRGGVLKDVRPLSERLRIRMPRPDTLSFDVRMDSADEGFDVALSGDFRSLTVDLRIDRERRPSELAIGAQADRPFGLPVQLNLDDASPVWGERAGFP